MFGDEPAEAWEQLADALLAREVARFRARRDSEADPFAGLHLSDEVIDEILAGDPTGAATGAAPDDDAEDAVAEARDAFRQSLAEPSRFAALAGSAELRIDEAEVLALLLAVELDPGRQRLVAYVQDDVTRLHVTIATLGRALAPGGHLAVGLDAALRRACLVDVDTTGPWSSRAVRVPAPVAWRFAGDPSLDPDLAPQTTMLSADRPVTGHGDLLFVSGGDRRTRTMHALRRFGGAVLVTPAPQSPSEWDAVVRTATLESLAVVLEIDDQLEAEATHRLSRATHLSWAVSSPAELPIETLPERAWHEITVTDGTATPEEWEAAGITAPEGALLNREQLRLVEIASVANDGDVVAARRRLAGGHLDRLTNRIRPRRTWDDLVLPETQLTQVRELVSRFRHRRKVYGEWNIRPLPSAGVVGMFSGPSGTGKTLTAEVIAAEIGLDLFKLDLSAMVSKYIGETEKNLETVFGAAEVGDAVLFFDEADALFGKRSEVSDARDRYANIEVSYLLQRLERHDGMVLLATNLAKNIDSAFLRRIHAAVEFTTPEEPERLGIWQRAFPSTCPTEDLDLDWLARRFEITGGNIHNAATAAAFLAADRGRPVTMELVTLALKRELQKMGRLVNDAHFVPSS